MASIEIFRTGKHTSAEGKALTFGDAELTAMASAYAPATHEAPVVIGHPKGDAPAYGWVRGLTFADGVLSAELDQVDDGLKQLVDAGRYKKVSASFYEPDAAGNPKPGCYYLRHIGFLGAQPPAIKGLKAVHFADADAGIVTFADWDDMRVAGLFRSMRNWLLAKFGQADADAALPEFDVQQAAISAAAETDDAPTALSYEESAVNAAELQAAQAKLAADQAALAAAQAALDAQTASFAEREQQLAAAEAQRRRAGCASFAEQLVTEGRLLPKHKDGLVSFMSALDASGTVSFGEGAEAATVPALDWLQTFLREQPKVVDFSERAGGPDGTVDFSEPTLLAKAASERVADAAAKGRVINIAQAIDELKAGQ